MCTNCQVYHGLIGTGDIRGKDLGNKDTSVKSHSVGEVMIHSLKRTSTQLILTSIIRVEEIFRFKFIFIGKVKEYITGSIRRYKIDISK